MTVNVQTPYIVYVGNGTITDFTFTYGLVEIVDLLVTVDDVLQVRFTDYTVEPTPGFPKGNTYWNGGTVTFTTAPVQDAVVRLERRTTITQQTDYEDGEAFPAETHEEMLDKIIYILQELKIGLIDGSLTFDLAVVQAVSDMLITNSGGTDALLPAWVDETYAGMFHGEITESAPADESVATKPDGYVYIEVLP